MNGNTDIQATDELRVLEASLAEIRVLKDAVLATEKRLIELERPLRVWLDVHPGERIEDPEHGITALYEEATAPGGSAVDLVGLRDRDPATMARLLDLACLKVDWPVLRAKIAQAQIVLPRWAVMPAGKVQRLMVRKAS